jgi:polysaccharide biosynthesis/export protein
VLGADEGTVAKYGSIYENADGSELGEHPYRPAITARQRVALAGGYDIMRFQK